MDEMNRIGAKVTHIRESRKLSRQELVDRAELGAELIAQIEAGEHIPSLSPLIKIARVLGVRLGTFLDDQEQLGPVVARAGDRRKLMRISGKGQTDRSDLDFFALAPGKTSRHMEPFLIDIQAAAGGRIVPSAHEGEEFIHVLSGAVEIAYGKESYRLGEGDSIYYDSIVPHLVHTANGTTARILAVVYTPV
jgi:transcriptional regulator with XRE-family HTH domain